MGMYFALYDDNQTKIGCRNNDILAAIVQNVAFASCHIWHNTEHIQQIFHCCIIRFFD